MKEVARNDRIRLSRLFRNYPRMRGSVETCLEGKVGRAWVDDLRDPRTAVMLVLDFYYFAGDPTALAAIELVTRVVPDSCLIPPTEEWDALIRKTLNGRISTRRRVAFEPGKWDVPRLRAIVAGLPEGFVLKRIGREDAARFGALERNLVASYASYADFLENGVGFGIEHEGRFVAGVSSGALSSKTLEFEIQTHPDFQRRGLATITGARMILHCLEHGLEPSWDAANFMSKGLAYKLGFVNGIPYDAFVLDA